MTTEYDWNGLRVRRDEQGQWCFWEDHWWHPVNQWVEHPIDHAIIAELDKLYPLPGTVTLDNGDVWFFTEDRDGFIGWYSGPDTVGEDVYDGTGIAAMLDTLDRLQNGDDR